MAKNLMVISQKVFAPANYIARKMHKKSSRHPVGGTIDENGEIGDVDSLVSDLTDEDLMLTDKIKRQNNKRNKLLGDNEEVESVQDCAAELLEVQSNISIDVEDRMATKRETQLLEDGIGHMTPSDYNQKAGLGKEDHLVTGVVNKPVSITKASKASGRKKNELDDNYALREKVAELEKIVVRQSDEIACLKSAMADNLRRLQLLEQTRVNSGSQNQKGSGNVSKRTQQAQYRSHRALVDTTPVRKSTDSTGRKPLSSRKSGGVNASSPALNHLGVTKSRMVKSLTLSPTQLSGAKNLNHPLAIALNNTESTSRPWRPGGTPNPEAPDIYRMDAFIKPTAHSMSQTLPTTTGGRVEPPIVNRNSRALYHSMRHSSRKIGGKEGSYNKEDGVLKIFIKGRPVHLPLPTYAQPIDIESNGSLPKEILKLEWVYGYRGRDARNNIYYLPTGELIYFIAAVVVLYNSEEQTQRHYLGHTDDVKSIAIHPDKITIATGQVAGHSKPQGKPHIRIWSSLNLNTLFVIGLGEFEKAVCCLTFSIADGGQYLAAVDEANEHVLSIWLWEKEKKITEAKCSTEPILAVDFHPAESTSIITCGKSHLGFWTLNDKLLSKKQGIYEKSEKPKFVLCQMFLETGELVTGDSSGNIIVWNRETHKVDQVCMTAHEGPIFSLMLTKNNTILSGGGKDRLLKEWTRRLTTTGYQVELSDEYGSIRMLAQGPGGMVLVGTTKNCILQTFLRSSENGSTIQSGQDQCDTEEARPLVEGHIEEVWGVTVHPKQHRFVSVGYDGMLCVWDSLTRRLLWRRDLPTETIPLQCVGIHPTAEIIVVGCAGGRWLVIDAVTRETVRVHTDGNEQICCTVFSPDGRLLAIGSADSSVYIYSVTDNGTRYSRVGKCTGHSSNVSQLDWAILSSSAQHYTLRSVSIGALEVLYWSVTSSSCRQITSDYRDLDWANSCCSLDWTSVGVWVEGADSSDINAVARGHHLPLLCSADDFGKVNLFSHPCPYPKAQHHQYRGHSSHVTNVQFLFDDSRVISSGGKDYSIMQWEVV